VVALAPALIAARNQTIPTPFNATIIRTTRHCTSIKPYITLA